MVVRHQRPKVEDVPLVQCDAVQVRDAGNVNESLDPWAEAAFQLEHQVGRSGHDAGAFAKLGQDADDLVNRRSRDVFVPHVLIKPQTPENGGRPNNECQGFSSNTV